MNGGMDRYGMKQGSKRLCQNRGSEDISLSCEIFSTSQIFEKFHNRVFEKLNRM